MNGDRIGEQYEKSIKESPEEPITDSAAEYGGKEKPDWGGLTGEAPDWYRDMKFGLFFHWGPYSVPAYGNEWYSRNMYTVGTPQNRYHEKTYGSVKEFGYKDFYDKFTGRKFDADEWADLVVKSGAKYAGPVTEHADNFSLWASGVNPVNALNYGPKRDVCGECAKAFRNRGIKFLASFHHQWLWGWFMSTDPDADVYMPENEKYYGPALPLETGRMFPYRLPDEKFNRVWLAKVKEVIDFYAPDVLYFDSRTSIIKESIRFEMARYYYGKKGGGGVITYKQGDFPEGTGVLDMERGHFPDARSFPWQTDDRLEDNVTWCYVQNPKYRSADEIIRQLCDNVAKNGNLLLNVGPDVDGSFHPEAKKVLYEIGRWLSVNGEAIYGTRPWSVCAEGPTKVRDTVYRIEEQQGEAALSGAKCLGLGDFRFTAEPGAVYAIFFGWPEDGILHIRTLSFGKCPKIGRLTLLGSDCVPVFVQERDALRVTLSGSRPCDHAWVLKAEFTFHSVSGK